MIVEPKCSMSFYTLLFAYKKINLSRKLSLIVLAFSMAFRLGAFCFLLTAHFPSYVMNRQTTLSFVCYEQANFLRDIQKTLESVCEQALAEELNKHSSSTVVETSP